MRWLTIFCHMPHVKMWIGLPICSAQPTPILQVSGSVTWLSVAGGVAETLWRRSLAATKKASAMVPVKGSRTNRFHGCIVLIYTGPQYMISNLFSIVYNYIIVSEFWCKIMPHIFSIPASSLVGAGWESSSGDPHKAIKMIFDWFFGGQVLWQTIVVLWQTIVVLRQTIIVLRFVYGLSTVCLRLFFFLKKQKSSSIHSGFALICGRTTSKKWNHN